MNRTTGPPHSNRQRSPRLAACGLKLEASALPPSDTPALDNLQQPSCRLAEARTASTIQVTMRSTRSCAHSGPSPPPGAKAAQPPPGIPLDRPPAHHQTAEITNDQSRRASRRRRSDFPFGLADSESGSPATIPTWATRGSDVSRPRGGEPGWTALRRVADVSPAPGARIGSVLILFG